MRKAILNFLNVLVVLVMLDAIILTASMAQIITQGRSGNWAPFWSVQASWIINLIS